MVRIRVATVVLAAAATAASAQTPADIADLVGARGAGGETQMLARGRVRYIAPLRVRACR